MIEFKPTAVWTLPVKWNRHDYLIRKVIRIAINRYNKRVAKQISDYMGWSSDEVLTIINLMKDNKENYLDGSN